MVSCGFPVQVDRQSQFIQGYRVLFRQTSGLPAPGPWQGQDVKVPSERGVLLSGLKKGIVYEIKVRPYFNEFQGMDSESRTARTTEEGEEAGPVRGKRRGVWLRRRGRVRQGKEAGLSE